MRGEGCSQVGVILVHIIQSQHMRMVDQLHDSYLPLHLWEGGGEGGGGRGREGGGREGGGEGDGHTHT